MSSRHLSDDRLVEMSLASGPSSAEQRHLGACPACETRRADLAHLLSEIEQAATEDAEAAFPSGTLARQQRRVMRRIEQEGRPARVISFPAREPEERTVLREHPASRWIAAAAVAGLMVGLVAGRVGPQAGRGSPPAARAASRSVAPDPSFRAATALMSEEELLVRIELALDARGGAALQPLDDLTPHTGDGR